MSKRILTGALAALALAGGGALVVTSQAGAMAAAPGGASTTRLVTTTTSSPKAPAGWAAPDGDHLPAYSTEQPRGGAGSLRLDGTTEAVPEYGIQHAAPAGLTLADVAEVSYDWYRVAGTQFTSASVAYFLDTDAPCADPEDGTAYLINEPIYQRPGAGKLTTGQWLPTGNQATTAKWWSSCDLAKLDGEVGGNYTLTLDAVKAAFPDAAVAAYGVFQANPDVVAYADSVSLNNFETNFEPDPKPVNAKPLITFSQPTCNVVDVKVAVPAGSEPVRAIIQYNRRTYATPTVAGGQSTTYRLIFREDSKSVLTGKAEAPVQVFYESPVGTKPVLGPTRVYTTNCKR